MKGSKPIVSVLMTAYRGNEHFSKAVKSVLDQTYRDLELIIVLDPHPEDLCEKIIGRMDDKRIKMIVNEKHLGLVPSRNISLNAVKGKYCAIQDSDDISMPDRIEKEVAFLETNEEHVIVGSPCDVIDDKGEVIKKGISLPDQEQLYYNLLFANQFPHSSVMFRKEMVDRIGGYREELDLGEDYDLFLRILEHGRAHMMDDILVKWRDHSASTTASRHEQMEKSVFKIIQKNISHTMGVDVPEKDLALIIDNSIRGRTLRSIKETLSILEMINRKFIEGSPAWLDRDRLTRISRKKYLSLLSGQIVNGKIGVSIGLAASNVKHWPGLFSHLLSKSSRK